MNRHRALVLALQVIAAACARPEPPKDQPEHPLLEKLKPPPLNQPISVERKAEGRSAPQLPQGEASALLVLREGQLFTGTLEIAGRISITADRIKIEPAEGTPLEILYRLPRGLDLPGRREDSATVSVTELSGPAGANRQLRVRMRGGVFLAETWQRSSEPIDFEVGNDLRLVQRPGRRDGAAGYSEVELVAVEGRRTVTAIPIGKVTPIRTGRGSVNALVEVSHLLTPSDADAGQEPGGYALRAWLVASR